VQGGSLRAAPVRMEGLAKRLGTDDVWAEGLTCPPGEAWLAWLVECVRLALDARCVLVGELVGVRRERVHLLASSAAGAPPISSELATDATPAERAIADGSYLCASGVRCEYPGVPLLDELQAEAAVGVGLRDPIGRDLGLLFVVHDAPLANPSEVRALLERFRERAAGELEVRRNLQELQRILESTSRSSGDEIFPSLAAGVARALHVHTVVISQRVEGDDGRARTLARLSGGRTVPNGTYALAGSPSRELADQEPGAILVRGPEWLVRDAEELRGVRARAYVGTVLRDSTGRRIGHLCLIHDRPLAVNAFCRSLVTFTAQRAGAELERRQELEARLSAERTLLEDQHAESLAILAGGVAHDLNNLLVGVMGNTSLAKLEAPERSDLAVYLDEIERASQRAHSLAHEMLAYSGRGSFVLEPLDLDALIDDVALRLRGSLGADVEIHADCPPDLPRVMGDPYRLRQLLVNLALNAWEAIGTERAGTVRFAARRGIPAGLRSPAAEDALGEAPRLSEARAVCLEVVDDGCGMTGTTLDRIFEPFFTTKATSRGLGLSAVQGIVRAHGGQLHVASEPGRGTTVSILLPTTDEAPVRRRPEAPAPRRDWSAAGDVLLVDDEAPVRFAARKMLERLGFEVHVSSTCAEALARFEERGASLRLVLLDVTLPDRNGSDAFLEMRRACPDVPVVLMSGYDEREATARLRDVRPEAFLHKPFKLDDLRTVVHGVLGERARRP